MKILEFDGFSIADEDGLSKAMQTVADALPQQLLVAAGPMGKTEERLLEAGEKSAQQDLVLASTLAEGVRTFHMQLARQLTSGELRAQAEHLLSELFEELFELLQGLYLIGELSQQGRRILGSYADRASVVILAQALKQKGIQAQAICERQTYLAEDASQAAEFRSEIESTSAGEGIPVIPLALRRLAIQQ